ncbi:MAG: hypothetical protein KF894_06680 [Labilithrix sp.]|nr:hypothetical protein [Labilithrix sp.]
MAHHPEVLRSRVAAALFVVSVAFASEACTTSAAGDADDPGSGGASSSGASGGGGGPSCTNGKKDDAETDVDCGGACPARCEPLKGCAGDPDCASDLVCVKSVCAAATSTDGVRNGSETDIDCGGPLAPPCEVGATCLAPADCVEKVCVSGKCAPPAPDDGVQNGSETDVDCGGADAPACADGKSCGAASDCVSKVCTGDVCQVPTTSDGVRNGDETDIDCGGGAPAPLCASGKTCAEGLRDCTSKVCTGSVCQVPTGTDGVQNGDESAVDCGGTTTGAPRCGTGVACEVDNDCASNGCAFDKKCAARRSCARQLGGVTCGSGEVGAGGASHESCCASAPLAGSAVRMDKYLVTAGRMRAFIERLGGNVRAFAPTTTGWSAAWNPLVPSTVAEANVMLGSYWNGAPNDSDGQQSKRSCASGSFGGHTYWTAANGADYSDFTQNQLDVKALNCVGWHLARAFCSWDGGRLPTRAEIINAFRNGGATTYPWGNAAYDPGVQDSRLNHEFNYGFPNVAGRRLLGGGAAADIAWHVSPPGRFPLGRNNNGVEIAGNLLHWVSDGEYFFNWTLSWERHGANLNNQDWRSAWPGEPNGYYAIGFRCVYD